MSADHVSKNPFLFELLGLQQDGRQSISAPTNWTRSKPLLEVPTDLDSVVLDLAKSCLTSGSNKIGRWHFFIGSPGNGKSAAVGQLVRMLLSDYNCRIVDDNDTDIDRLAGDSVPYSLSVFEHGCDFPSMRIVQDASVVRNPYAADVDPAVDLLDSMREAWDRGISLIVCTNRGVLEKAFRDTYLNPDINQLPWHKSILRQLADSANETGSTEPIPTTGRHPVFTSIKASNSFLDNRSLILCGRGIFDGIIQQAVKEEKWTVCAGCSALTLCPFKANRDWLANDKGRDCVVNAFRRAEVLSTQVIVFREALAVISFLLAGCARDYHATHPCDWVKEMVARKDIFGLAMRRVYMALFSSSFPRGLEVSRALQDYQLVSLRELRDKQLLEDNIREVLNTVLDTTPPSTDVGIARLLGVEGVFSQLDALHGPLPDSFFDMWDGSYEKIKAQESPFISEIERQCLDVWCALEMAAENMPSHVAPDAYWAIRRWSTQFTLHLGSLIENKAYASEQIDEFAELLELLWRDKSLRTPEDLFRLQKLEDVVERLMNRDGDRGNDGSAVAIAENVQIKGRWVENQMRPRINASPTSGSLTIAVRFGKSSDYTTLTAPVYLWLRQRAGGTIDPRCIPDDLLNAAMDAKGRAAARSDYAFSPDDISLIVQGERESFTLTRFDGRVVVNADNQP